MNASGEVYTSTSVFTSLLYQPLISFAIARVTTLTMTKITWNEKADAKVRLDLPLCDRLFGVPVFLSFVPILNNIGGCAECLAYNGKVTGK